MYFCLIGGSNKVLNVSLSPLLESDDNFSPAIYQSADDLIASEQIIPSPFEMHIRTQDEDDDEAEVRNEVLMSELLDRRDKR